ncbi:MAG: hypothetical protein CVU46_01190 [Chloroflexi bacterium HGW-Chloroflexi-8]|nr:MAG: hypothetical protein CVU46_01190 [Chloroflexi bacterium HGW-Chloroflexi-8]
MIVLLVVLLTVADAGHRFKKTGQSQITQVNIDQISLILGEEGTVWLEPTSSFNDEFIELKILGPAAEQTQYKGKEGFFGLAGVQTLWLAKEDRETEMALVAATGARYIGMDFEWGKIEKEQGKYDWSGPDDAVRLAKQYGLTIVPMLLFTPQWASPTSFAPLDYKSIPPVDEKQYRDFVFQVVNRYKPFGQSTYVKDGYGISDWVIWNEPNVQPQGKDPLPGNFWIGELEAYIQLMRAGFEGAHAADPSCNVLNGGLADVYWRQGEADLVTAVERLYDPNGDGDAGDGARPYFDTLNIHIYPPVNLTPEEINDWLQYRIDAISRVMDRFGDDGKKIWVTETGFGSVPSSNNLNETPQPDNLMWLDEKGQSDSMLIMFEKYVQFPKVETVLWWSLRDYYINQTGENQAMEAHYGLVNADFSPKSSYLAYARMVGGMDILFSSEINIGSFGRQMVVIPKNVISRAGNYLVVVTPILRGENQPHFQTVKRTSVFFKNIQSK